MLGSGVSEPFRTMCTQLAAAVAAVSAAAPPPQSNNALEVGSWLQTASQHAQLNGVAQPPADQLASCNNAPAVGDNCGLCAT